MPGIIDTLARVTTGIAFESAAWPFLFDSLTSLTDEQIEKPLLHLIDYCKNTGVSCVFDSGFPEHEGFSYNLPQDVYFCGKKMN